MQVCNTCEENKSLSNFYYDKRYDRYHKRCNKCCSDAKKKRWDANPDKYREYQKEYRKLTRSEYNKYMVQYRKEHPDYVKKQNHEYYYEKGGKEKNRSYAKSRLHITREQERKRYHTDMQFRLRKVLRTRMNKFVKKRTIHSSDLLDCDIDFYTKYLEIQFSGDMNWKNYGSYWNIDHVIPCASFDLSVEENQKICFHWSNTRPYIKSENESKQDTIDKDSIIAHSQFLNTLTDKIQITIPSYSRKGLMAQINKLGYGNNSSDVIDEKSI